jgi:hypothetical protein
MYSPPEVSMPIFLGCAGWLKFSWLRSRIGVEGWARINASVTFLELSHSGLARLFRTMLYKRFLGKGETEDESKTSLRKENFGFAS